MDHPQSCIHTMQNRAQSIESADSTAVIRPILVHWVYARTPARTRRGGELTRKGKTRTVRRLFSTAKQVCTMIGRRSACGLLFLAFLIAAAMMVPSEAKKCAIFRSADAAG